MYLVEFQDCTGNLMSRKLTATRFMSIGRVFRKLVGLVAMYAPISGQMRAKLQAIRGVRFEDVSGCYIGGQVYLDDMSPESIFIGKNVVITSGTKILVHFYDSKHVPDEKDIHKFYYGKVRIEADCFIGMNVVVARPVTIGKGAVVAANSLIMSDVAPYTIVAGVPAVKLKDRFEK